MALKIPILSFFAGGGFLDLGFEQAGFNVVWSNEISYEISQIYKSGLSSALNRNMEISSTKSIEDLSISVLKRDVISKLKTQIWGIIGGPPCPDFSVGGKNKGRNGDLGKLSKKYVEDICVLKPSFFVFENVKGLIQTQRHREFFMELVSMLEKNKYAVDFKLINALDFGVPQDRERIILFGVRKGIYRKATKKNYKEGERNWFSWPLPKYPDAKRNFNWDTDATENIPPDELKVGTYIMNQTELNVLANSNEFFNPKSSKFEEIEEGDTSRKSFKRLNRNKYSPTVAYGNNEVHLHPVLNRRLTVREALRLQSVPDSYVINGKISLSTKFKVIGNGVPVTLSYEIAKAIKHFLDRID